MQELLHADLHVTDEEAEPLRLLGEASGGGPAKKECTECCTGVRRFDPVDAVCCEREDVPDDRAISVSDGIATDRHVSAKKSPHPQANKPHHHLLILDVDYVVVDLGHVFVHLDCLRQDTDLAAGPPALE